MILSNLKKMFWRMNTTGNFPIPPNGSTDGDSSHNPHNAWLTSISQDYGDGCDFPLNSIGYTYGSARNQNTFLAYRYKVESQNNPGFFVGIGTGTTAENTDDYDLASMDTQLEHRYGHVKRDPSNGVILQVESVYENLTGSDVVIKEIGLYAYCRLPSYIYGNWNKNNFLIARKVLASPVTIHNNEVYKFIYKIDI